MPLAFFPTSEFDVSVAMGTHRNTNGTPYRHASVHGRAAVATGTGTAIAGSAFWFPTAPSAVRVKAGGNAADSVAGAGARQLTIVGLDSNLDLATETLDTAGASASAYTNTLWWRINQVFVSRAGSYGGINGGIVTLEDSAPGDVLQMAARECVSNMALYSIPRGHTGLMRYAAAAVGGTVAATVILSVRTALDQVSAPFSASIRARILQSVQAGFFNFDLERAPIVIPEKSDAFAVGTVASGTVPVSLFASILLVPNS